MRVAVNLNMFHPELPLLQRYKAAAAAGFRQVEVALPYSEKAEDLKKTADSLGLSHTLINAPAGEWSKGFRGLASLPAHKKEFQDSISTAIQYAKTLSCDKVHVMAGIPAQNDGDVSKLYQENVAFAANKLGEANLMCLIEPINHYSIPGYFLSTYEQAKAVIDAVAMPNLKMQYDVFHAQQICGQITATIKKYKDLIGYIQVAQVPSRDEPITAGLEHNFNESHGKPSEWIQNLDTITYPADSSGHLQNFMFMQYQTFYLQINPLEKECNCSCAKMRNAARTNWAHDVVRMSAVAPIRKQQSKKLRLHQDDPLSDGEDEGPKKIRSYIKPSKNIDTYARRIQPKFEKLMKSHGLNRTKLPHNSSMRPPPMRKERRDLNRSPKQIHRGPAPVARSFSAPSSSKDVRHVDQARSSDTRIIHEGKSSQFMKIKSKDAQQSKNMEGKKCEKIRPPPPRPPLPEKRTQTSSAISFTDFGVQCDLTEICPPAKKSREDELESSAIVTTPAANSANPLIVSSLANEGSNVSLPPNEGFSVSTPASEVGTVAAPTDVKWNEHLNLAYLFKRGSKIFTIDTLPATENWYKDIFYDNAADDRNIERASPIEKVGQSSPVNSITPKTCFGGEDRRTSTPAQIAARDGGRSTVLSEADAGHRQDFEKKRAREEIPSTPHLKSCLMLSKKTVKRRISFSDDLVSVRHFEVDAHWEEQVVPPTVPPAIAAEHCQMHSERTRINSETGSSHDRSTVGGNDPVRDQALAQQQQPSHLPVVKQEPIDEDDDIVVLFSGKTEYIEKLRREHILY
ncbi:unnamed protein product [Cylicocyclus nassatus]|uniref:Xylose isomerase-like TIM barrel domain-containing protein n=1 Tax=Cylicocyclus nassatus TaxID=53992 RepID=A0AA36GRM8_CYLNA|nr:unnamed protein product [Cylicocyclus nassatus]